MENNKHWESEFIKAENAFIKEKEKNKNKDRLLKLILEQHHDVLDQFIYEELYAMVKEAKNV